MTIKAYSPGLHILAEITTFDSERLQDAEAFMDFIKGQIDETGLNALGHVVHSFEGAGFTAVVCLTESHLSIHTWPEFNKLTFDVFLSNFSRENDEKCRLIFKNVNSYFDAVKVDHTEIKR